MDFGMEFKPGVGLNCQNPNTTSTLTAVGFDIDMTFHHHPTPPTPLITTCGKETQRSIVQCTLI